MQKTEEEVDEMEEEDQEGHESFGGVESQA